MDFQVGQCLSVLSATLFQLSHFSLQCRFGSCQPLHGFRMRQMNKDFPDLVTDLCEVKKYSHEQTKRVKSYLVSKMDRYIKYQKKQYTYTHTHNRWWLVFDWMTSNDDHLCLTHATSGALWSPNCALKPARSYHILNYHLATILFVCRNRGYMKQCIVGSTILSRLVRHL